MTRCSCCGRKLRIKVRVYGMWDRTEDWLNHQRDCLRYGRPPDAK